uniref:Uncharacterized protein n=1 Tax=Tanacetum cinerariifolium TaxID=118510 RepID=A0A699J4G5_TANCI|nr:hypothetical protein [Tanacetum cinerariifolium]
MRLQALVDKKKVVVTEATIRDALCLDDAEGVECLPNEIFAELARMGYEKPSTKLMKQVGDLSTHTTKYTSPALTQKVFANMRRVGKGFFGVETTLFERMIAEQQVDKGDEEVNVDNVSTAGVAAEGDVSVANDEVHIADEEPSILSPTHLLHHHNHLKISLPLPKKVEYLEKDKIAQALEIIKLKQRVKKLKRRNKVKVLKLKRLQKVRTAQQIETSDDTVMDDVSNQERMIADMDEDADVVLEEAKDVADDINKDEDESEPTEVQKVVDVVTTTNIIIEVVTASSDTITAASTNITTVDAQVPAAITTAAPSRLIEPKPLKKQAQIKQDEAFARELEAELNRNIDWDEVIDHVNKKAKEDPAVKRYQALKRKPQTEAQARKNMMIYLKNVAGFKIDYFKGMSYDDIRPIFEAKFNSNMAFLHKTKEQIDEEDSRALKRINETPAEKVAKKKKLDEEVEELKRHLQIVPNEEDDVYTKATPLALKVPVVDYEIYNENNKPYYKIKRADGSHQLYLSFLSLLRNFDKEDLEALWR